MELNGLRAEIASLAAVDPTLSAASDLGDGILEALQLRNALSALISGWVGAFDAAEGYADEQLTVAAWLRTQTTMSAHAASGEKTVARLIRKLPALAAAYAEGGVSPAQLRAVAAVLPELPEELWGEVDANLVVLASTMTAAEIGDYLRKLADAIKNTPKPRDETQHESRRLSLSVGFNGMTTVVGRLTPEVAEKLHAALSAASRPDVDGETRRPNQRKADALDTVLDHVLDTARLPVDGGEKPHLTVTVDLDQLTEDAQTADELPICPHGTPEQRIAAAHAIAAATDSRPRFAWTGPTRAGTARRLSCDGILLPIFTRGGQPLDVGRRTRVVPAALRAFIVARDTTCRWPGCGMSARWSQIHHAQHWRDGGRTDRANLILICDAHHRAAHSGRWTINLQAPGVLTVARRTPGQPYYRINTTAPPPADPLGLTWNNELRTRATRASRAGQR